MAVQEGWDVTDRVAQCDLLRQTAVGLYNSMQVTRNGLEEWVKVRDGAEGVAKEVVTDWEGGCQKLGEELPDWYDEVDRGLMVHEIAKRIKRDLP